MAERLGKYTIVLNSHPSVTGFAAVVGKTEGEGPLKDEFDFVFEDDTLGEVFHNTYSDNGRDTGYRNPIDCYLSGLV